MTSPSENRAGNYLLEFLHKVVEGFYPVTFKRRIQVRVTPHVEVDVVLLFDGVYPRISPFLPKRALFSARTIAPHARGVWGAFSTRHDPQTSLVRIILPGPAAELVAAAGHGSLLRHFSGTASSSDGIACAP